MMNEERFENQIILALNRIAGATARLTKQIAIGYVASEVTGAIADLRNASNLLEMAQRQYDGPREEER